MASHSNNDEAGLGLRVAALAYTCFYLILFSPTIIGGRLLAPGDSLLQSVPAMYSPFHLWTPYLFSGYPIAADPQSMSWYPLAWMFSWGFSSWNAFVLSGYVLASVLTYGYVWSLTKSRVAASAAGVIYGASGVLMSALPHPHLIHSAAWLPLMIWSLQELRSEVSRKWVALLAIAVGLSALAGFPQIFVYALGLSFAYACFSACRAPVGARAYVLASGAGVSLGLGLAAVLLLPMAELIPQTVRAEGSFDLYTSGSLLPRQLPALLLPSGWDTMGRVPQGLYIGVVGWLLAGLGLFLSHRRQLIMFWSAIAVLSLLLALGGATPLGTMMFSIPGFPAFRAPVRHFVEVTFSVAVLSGLSLAGVLDLGAQKASRLLRRVGWILAALLLTSAMFLIALENPGDLSIAGLLSELASPPRLIPFAFLFIGVVSLSAWCKRPTWLRGAIVIFVIVLSFTIDGQILDWQNPSPSISEVQMSESLNGYRERLTETEQRLSPLDGLMTAGEAGRPNLSRLWRIPSASGYNPLILARYSEFFGMAPTGDMPLDVLEPTNRTLDLVGVRYLSALVPRALDPSISPSEMAWPPEDLGLRLGSGCGQDQPNSLEVPLPGISLRRIGLITNMACAEAIPDGSPVLQISLTSTDESPETELGLRAGMHTAEWAWERDDVRPIVRHERAPVFRSSLTEDNQGVPFEAHQYVAMMPVTTNAPIRSLRFEWVGPTGEISLAKLVLEDSQGASYVIGDTHLEMSAGPRWTYVEHLGSTPLFENRNAMPRVWLTPSAVALEPAEILRTVRESTLPSGEEFDPREVALVERPIELEGGTLDDGTSVSIVDYLPGRVEIDVDTPTESLLVLGDTFYPGWMASIDGVKSEVFRTNYILRGVLVGPGTHRVVFTYRPLAVYLGLAISLVVLALLSFMLRLGTVSRI